MFWKSILSREFFETPHFFLKISSIFSSFESFESETLRQLSWPINFMVLYQVLYHNRFFEALKDSTLILMCVFRKVSYHAEPKFILQDSPRSQSLTASSLSLPGAKGNDGQKGEMGQKGSKGELGKKGLKVLNKSKFHHHFGLNLNCHCRRARGTRLDWSTRRKGN